jgi:hypothetical protein
MTKLTRDEVLQRLDAALALLGNENCEDARCDLRMKLARTAIERARRNPEVDLGTIANDLRVT